jgi:hypothetical protein
MHPFKGDVMMTQDVKVKVASSDTVDVASRAGEQVVPIIRLLYSFHSSGSEIKQLLGQRSYHPRMRPLTLLTQMRSIRNLWLFLNDRVIPACLIGYSCV